MGRGTSSENTMDLGRKCNFGEITSRDFYGMKIDFQMVWSSFHVCWCSKRESMFAKIKFKVNMLIHMAIVIDRITSSVVL